MYSFSCTQPFSALGRVSLEPTITQQSLMYLLHKKPVAFVSVPEIVSDFISGDEAEMAERRVAATFRVHIL